MNTKPLALQELSRVIFNEKRNLEALLKDEKNNIKYLTNKFEELKVNDYENKYTEQSNKIQIALNEYTVEINNIIIKIQNRIVTFSKAVNEDTDLTLDQLNKLAKNMRVENDTFIKQVKQESKNAFERYTKTRDDVIRGTKSAPTIKSSCIIL